MPVDVNEVINLLALLADQENLRVTVRESVKAGVIAGAATIVGGLLGGPPGIAIGGTIGALSAAAMSYKKFESVGTILNKMDAKDKQLLFEKAQKILTSLSVTDLETLSQALTNEEIRKQLLATIVDHVEGQLRMTIVD